MHRGGTKVSLVSGLVQALNAKLFERAWQLLAAPELVADSCLFVMGSEGRGKQLLKTDQDNGLVLRDGDAAPDDLAAICERFAQALARFGYPPCPGCIMVNNPDGRHSLADFGLTVRRWLLMPTADSLMALAIFFDAHAVCGHATLLAPLRRELFALVTDHDALLAGFAAAVLKLNAGLAALEADRADAGIVLSARALAGQRSDYGLPAGGPDSGKRRCRVITASAGPGCPGAAADTGLRAAAPAPLQPPQAPQPPVSTGAARPSRPRSARCQAAGIKAQAL